MVLTKKFQSSASAALFFCLFLISPVSAQEIDYSGVWASGNNQRFTIAHEGSDFKFTRISIDRTYKGSFVQGKFVVQYKPVPDDLPKVWRDEAQNLDRELSAQDRQGIIDAGYRKHAQIEPFNDPNGPGLRIWPGRTQIVLAQNSNRIIESNRFYKTTAIVIRPVRFSISGVDLIFSKVKSELNTITNDYNRNTPRILIQELNLAKEKLDKASNERLQFEDNERRRVAKEAKTIERKTGISVTGPDAEGLRQISKIKTKITSWERQKTKPGASRRTKKRLAREINDAKLKIVRLSDRVDPDFELVLKDSARRRAAEDRKIKRRSELYTRLDQQLSQFLEERARKLERIIRLNNLLSSRFDTLASDDFSGKWDQPVKVRSDLLERYRKLLQTYKTIRSERESALESAMKAQAEFLQALDKSTAATGRSLNAQMMINLGSKFLTIFRARATGGVGGVFAAAMGEVFFGDYTYRNSMENLFREFNIKAAAVETGKTGSAETTKGLTRRGTIKLLEKIAASAVFERKVGPLTANFMLKNLQKASLSLGLGQGSRKGITNLRTEVLLEMLQSFLIEASKEFADRYFTDEPMRDLAAAIIQVNDIGQFLRPVTMIYIQLQKRVVDLDREIEQTTRRLPLIPSIEFYIDRNEPFVAAQGYRFKLKTAPSSRRYLRRARINMKLGDVDLSRARPLEFVLPRAGVDLLATSNESNLKITVTVKSRRR